MKTHAHMKGRGAAKVSPQQVIFELKQKVVHALNKLADRDTYQIGVEEIEKIADGLTPEMIAPFLSCVVETDSAQKSTVRKECIRIMGTLVRLHEGLLGPHLGKMIASIVKRLKDPDSVVRDACVEVVGVLSSKLSNCGNGSDGGFIVMVQPLFEALGEQNRQVQAGSALCLASAIDNAVNPPISVLHRMLTRITKLIKNPHFMTKPAVIELMRSIIQAGGAPTQNALSAAISNIQEALKSSDWTTRKAAAAALAGIAISGGSFLLSIKGSCLCTLESCRFDKVKPVRDAALQALQFWKSLSGIGSCEPSEAGSSTKENFYGGDYSDLTSASDSGVKSITSKKAVICSASKRVPLISRKTSPNVVQKSLNSKTNDWHVEIAVPKRHAVPSEGTYNEESEGNCYTKNFDRTDANASLVQDMDYDYLSMDDRPECSTRSTDFKTKHVIDTHDCLEKGALVSPVERNQCSETEEVGYENLTCSEGRRDRQSLDSTVTVAGPQSRQKCCSQTASALSSIQKKLQEIETKQSSLMDLLQVFMGSTMDILSTMQSKVLGLEHAIDRIAHDFIQEKKCSNVASSKPLKSYLTSSPRISICTPRPSLDINNRKSSLKATITRGVVREATFCSSRSSISDKQDVDMWGNPNVIRNRGVKGMQQSSGPQPQNLNCLTRKVEDVISPLAYNAKNRKCNAESTNSLWKRVKDFLCNGDLDSAFVEVLCCGDDMTLIELLDRTGPVLERLSHETVGEILGTLAMHFLDQRFLDSIIPWLQQVVDLSTTHGPDYLVLSAEARREFLSAIQEAASMNFPNPADRRTVTQMALRLRKVWGKSSWLENAF